MAQVGVGIALLVLDLIAGVRGSAVVPDAQTGVGYIVDGMAPRICANRRNTAGQALFKLYA
jgi:hypothetical protein